MPKVLPRFAPMRLLPVSEPFDHPDWIFELKYDGFRALAYVRHRKCELISRRGNTYKSFKLLCDWIASKLPVRDAILDGEIVCLDESGRPQFNPLLRRRGEACFVAFDLLWLDGKDLRELPLVERKAKLKRIIPKQPSLVLYLDHLPAKGTDLFRRAGCARWIWKAWWPSSAKRRIGAMRAAPAGSRSETRGTAKMEGAVTSSIVVHLQVSTAPNG